MSEPLPREIWDRSVEEGERRMGRSPLGQAATGLIGGFDVVVGLVVATTITGAFASTMSEEAAHTIGSLGFGVAFVLITIGHSELFTENFLVPVGARLAGRGSPGALARMWGLTLAFNLIGAVGLAAIVSVHGVLPASAYEAAGQLADTFAGRGYGEAFASAVVAGAVMTVYTWLGMAARSDVARIILALLIGFLLLLPALNHVVVGFCELMLGVISGASHPDLGEALAHFGVALAGNAVGGVGFVTITRLVQVGGEPHDAEHAEGSEADERPAESPADRGRYVHPMPSEREFDVIVLGAGPAGEVVAGRLADAGEDVALVERELVGGECSFYACMPSKALLRPVELLAEVKRVPGLPVSGELDVPRILERRDEVIHDLDDSAQMPWLEKRDIELFRHDGRLDGERRVVAGEDVLTARKAVVVATGSGPSIPPIEGLDEVATWSSRQVTTAKRAPESMIVLGGGVVGVEMAQAWSALGTEVTIVEAVDRLLLREEPFASEEVTDALRDHGVDVRVGAKATKVSQEDESGPITLQLEGGESITAARLLVAVGRAPRVEDIGLESVGVGTDGPIEVGDDMRVDGHDWLYAIGDVNGRVLLTHMGKYQARVAAANILGGNAKAVRDDSTSPRVVFTDPEVAAVGHTVASAEEAGLKVRAVDVSTAGNAGASFHGRDAAGTSRLVIDEDRGIVVGATFVGPDANELLHAATVAVVAEVPLDRLFEAVPAFPTRNEIWLNLLEKYGL